MFFSFNPVAPNITSPHSTTLIVNEKQTAQLVCTATGYPTPSINWTRNGVVIGTGSPFNITAKLEDHNQCYTCVAYNGVPDAKSANVCLVVQGKYRSALGHLKSTVTVLISLKSDLAQRKFLCF